jgi:hypothetical protein
LIICSGGGKGFFRVRGEDLRGKAVKGRVMFGCVVDFGLIKVRVRSRFSSVDTDDYFSSSSCAIFSTEKLNCAKVRCLPAPPRYGSFPDFYLSHTTPSTVNRTHYNYTLTPSTHQDQYTSAPSTYQSSGSNSQA